MDRPQWCGLHRSLVATTSLMLRWATRQSARRLIGDYRRQAVPARRDRRVTHMRTLSGYAPTRAKAHFTSYSYEYSRFSSCLNATVSPLSSIEPVKVRLMTSEWIAIVSGSMTRSPLPATAICAVAFKISF